MTLPEAIAVVLSEVPYDQAHDLVRENAVEDADGFEGPSWEHPRVQRFEQAMAVLKAAAETPA